MGFQELEHEIVVVATTIFHGRFEVIVDEFVPCKVGKGEPVPCFAEPLGEELWVLLLEKATG